MIQNPHLLQQSEQEHHNNPPQLFTFLHSRGPPSHPWLFQARCAVWVAQYVLPEARGLGLDQKMWLGRDSWVRHEVARDEVAKRTFSGLWIFSGMLYHLAKLF